MGADKHRGSSRAKRYGSFAMGLAVLSIIEFTFSFLPLFDEWAYAWYAAPLPWLTRTGAMWAGGVALCLIWGRYGDSHWLSTAFDLLLIVALVSALCFVLLGWRAATVATPPVLARLGRSPRRARRPPPGGDLGVGLARRRCRLQRQHPRRRQQGRPRRIFQRDLGPDSGLAGQEDPAVRNRQAQLVQLRVLRLPHDSGARMVRHSSP